MKPDGSVNDINGIIELTNDEGFQKLDKPIQEKIIENKMYGVGLMDKIVGTHPGRRKSNMGFLGFLIVLIVFFIGMWVVKHLFPEMGSAYMSGMFGLMGALLGYAFAVKTS